MSNDNLNIHDFDFNLICDYFNQVERQGPGSKKITELAASFIENLPDNAKIADLGCGTGTQTLTLANSVKGDITALDLFPNFIKTLQERIEKTGNSNRITAVTGSMDNLPFAKNELDLIWSEGAIYNIGFKRGLNEWNKYLKKGGYIAVSEVSWFTKQRPAEIEKFWMDAYSEIDTIANKVDQLQDAGYIPVAVFNLPVNCWEENFYKPMLKVMEPFLKKYHYNKAAVDFIENQKHEIELFRKYNDYYGYTFYIGKKI